MKVVIVGLLPSQERFLKEEFPQVNFVFMDVDKRNMKVPKADLYVLRTKFINHTTTAKFIESTNGQNLFQHRKGGVRALIEWLRDKVPEKVS